MNILCLFGGQGSLQSDLFKACMEDPLTSKKIKEFSKLAGIDFGQTSLTLSDPYYVQVLIGCYQLSIFWRLEPFLKTQTLDCAGYSLGEFSAFLASTQASPSVAYQALSYRTKLMTSLLKQKPKTYYDLLAIKGDIHITDIQALCTHYECFIAIRNVAQGLVLGGRVMNLKQLQVELKRKGSKSKFLNIQLPSHTPFYAPQNGKLKEYLSHLNLESLHYPLFNALRLSKIYDKGEEEKHLDEELYTTLRWDKICELILEYRYELIIDLGPGSALTRFLQLTPSPLSNHKLPILTLADYKSINGFMEVLKNRLNTHQG